MLEVRIAQIKSRILTREGKPGYKRNVKALKQELAKLETHRASRVAKPAAKRQIPPALTPPAEPA